MKEFLNKRIIIENTQGSKYTGILGGFKDQMNKFCLTNLCILNKDGSYKAISGSRETRWFEVEKFSIVGVANE